jgi:hypothetical protein
MLAYTAVPGMYSRGSVVLSRCRGPGALIVCHITAATAEPLPSVRRLQHLRCNPALPAALLRSTRVQQSVSPLALCSIRLPACEMPPATSMTSACHSSVSPAELRRAGAHHDGKAHDAAPLLPLAPGGVCATCCCSLHVSDARDLAYLGWQDLNDGCTPCSMATGGPHGGPELHAQNL